MTSKLETINNLLKSNPQVVMGERDIYNDGCFSWVYFFDSFPPNIFEESREKTIQKVYFPIAPKEEIYKMNELNQFKDSLLSNLNLKNTNFAWMTENSSILTGKLECSEVIATEKANCKRDIELKESDLIEDSVLKTFVNNQRNFEHNKDFRYMREIGVLVFPHKDLLKIYSKYGVGKDYISSTHHQMEHECPKIIKKLFDSNKK